MKKYFFITLVVLLGMGCLTRASWWPFSWFSSHSNGVTPSYPISIDIQAVVAGDIENIVDIIVIGSGPAGLSACVYGCRAGRYVACFEGDEPGGLLVTTTYVENWPGEKSILGRDIVDHIHEQAAELGAQFIADTVTAVDFSRYPYRIETRNGLVLYALSVIIAAGAQPKKLGVPGEDLYWGRGVQTCAVCHGTLTRGRDVVVVGGGDSAVEEAIQLVPYARSITILVRGDSMRAAVTMQERLSNYPSIKVRYNASITEVIGDENVMTDMMVRDNKTGTTTREPIFMIFLAIGHVPNTWMLGNQVTVCKTGHIALFNSTQATSVPGVFAAGDVTDNRYRQAGVAAGDGIKAALDADKFLVEMGYSQIVARQLDDRRFIPPITLEPLLSLDTIEQMQKIVVPGSGLVFIDCYTEHCASCRNMIPLFERAAQLYADTVTIYSLDIEKSPDLADLWRVDRVPTLLIFKDGILVATMHQMLDQAQLNAIIERYNDTIQPE